MTKLLQLASLFVFGIHASYLLRDPQDFEVIVNEELYEFRYHMGEYMKEPLLSTTDVTGARIQNVQGDIDLMKCLFWADRSQNYLSSVFDQRAPFEEPFPAAEKILCHPFVEVPDSTHFIVYMQPSQHEPYLRAGGIEAGLSTWIGPGPYRSFKKVAIVGSPDPRIVCIISFENQEIIRISVGEDWVGETSKVIDAIVCRTDSNKTVAME